MLIETLKDKNINDSLLKCLDREQKKTFLQNLVYALQKCSYREQDKMDCFLLNNSDTKRDKLLQNLVAKHLQKHLKVLFESL